MDNAKDAAKRKLRFASDLLGKYNLSWRVDPRSGESEKERGALSDAVCLLGGQKFVPKYFR